MQINKTDQNDAEGLAQIVRTGWYRSVHVKSLDSHRARAILGARLAKLDESDGARHRELAINAAEGMGVLAYHFLLAREFDKSLIASD